MTMLLSPPSLYLVIDLVLGRLFDFSRLQALYYLLSLLASLALWILAAGILAGLRRGRPRLAWMVTILLGALYGVNLVLVYGYRLIVGALPNYYTFTFLFDEPRNSWTLFLDSLRTGHVAVMVLMTGLWILALRHGSRHGARAPVRRTRSPWGLGLAATVFVVIQLVLHNNIRFVDQSYVADLTTTTGLLRNVSTRLSRRPVGLGGLGARIPTPVPDLPENAPAGAHTIDGRPVNVLIILTESLRADELGLYGQSRSTSPFLDSLVTADAQHVVRFARAFSPASSTFISLPSLITGLAPVMPARLLHTQPVFWEYFKAMGRQTFFFTSQSHEWRHLKVYFTIPAIDDLYNMEIAGFKRINDMGVDDRHVVDHFLGWLGHRDTAVAFAGLLQFNQTHYPFWTPEDARPFGTDTPRDRYDNAVRYDDRQVARIIQGLTERGLRDRTLIVLTSDHGEGFMEHGFLGHLSGLYRECRQIPMLVFLPAPLIGDTAWSGRLAVLTANSVRNVANPDILPTLLDFAGVWNDPSLDGVRDGFYGQSLLRPVDPNRPLIASNSNETSSGHSNLSLITGDWHYLLNLQGAKAGTEELYHWADDPGEKINRIDIFPPELRTSIYGAFARYELCRRIFRGCGIPLDTEPTDSPGVARGARENAS
ncbi:MAG: sulfatase [Candidatus Zixiibacteriota bacterium]